MAEDKLTVSRILEERHQGHGTRKDLYPEIEKRLGMPVVAYYTSFRYPVMIDDSDVDMLEALLQKCDLSKGLVLFLSSPGGKALAAERVVNLCRSYSGTGEFQVIIVGKAKSAATMIALGASKIIMSNTSELGPIDTMMYLKDQALSVTNVVNSYENLFKDAIKEKGNLEPYIQQLAKYDAREIEEMRLALALSEDIAVKYLKSGMLTGKDEDKIKDAITVFLKPTETKDHGRPIYADDAIQCGLNVEIVNLDEHWWTQCYNLHIRLLNYVRHNSVAKCIECKDDSFLVAYDESSGE